jgi:hypothetical protein
LLSIKLIQFITNNSKLIMDKKHLKQQLDFELAVALGYSQRKRTKRIAINITQQFHDNLVKKYHLNGRFRHTGKCKLFITTVLFYFLLSYLFLQLSESDTVLTRDIDTDMTFRNYYHRYVRVFCDIFMRTNRCP